MTKRRTIPMAWMLSAASAAFILTVTPQANAQANPYQGVSQPPNDAIVTSPDAPPPTKPSPAVVAQPAPAASSYTATSSVPQPTSAGPTSTGPISGYVPDDSGPVMPPDPAAADSPALSSRPAIADPDGDIVHPRQARPGELVEGATIRVKLLDRLSSAESEKGEPFHGQVEADVLQDGKVMIPAGSAIEGRITSVSSGHFGGHGSLRLRPETVILPDGSRFQMNAETTGTLGSHTRMGEEGAINPGSRAKKDGVEYGAVVGTGAVTGAVLGGPIGALTGSLVGAGLVTTHLMVDHPQATLEPGSIVLFTLTEPMNLIPSAN